MFWKKKPQTIVEKEEEFTTSIFATHSTNKFNLENTLAKSFQITDKNFADYFKITDEKGKVYAMDSSPLQQAKSLYAGFAANIPTGQIDWYSSQGFIGYQLLGILAQHWLIDKACSTPARDAIRNGFEITVNDGTKIEPEVLDKMRELDVNKYRLNEKMLNYIRFGRVFGIRIAVFKVDGIDYEKPFNMDGVQPGSYKGITLVDPYWITPELDIQSASDPSSLHFYEPTWWRISGQRYHRSHLKIFRPAPVADILKPSYIWGGLSTAQKIYERVYAAERSANEMPMLAMTKRMFTYQMDITNAIANQQQLESQIQNWVSMMNNYGIKIINSKEKIEQHETSLTGLDDVVMTQYQLVAGASNVPVTKLLGTVPKGFNSTGEHEEASYHEELESIQSNDLTAFVEHHHALMIRSDIARLFPQYEGKPFRTSAAWKPLDAMTAEELSKVNLTKAETGLRLQQAGAIDGEDERQRLINDADSGYNGMPERIPEEPLEENLPTENLENPEAEGSTNIPVRPSSPVQGANPDDEDPADKAKAQVGKTL